jgi:3-phenylpropionate/trans-cinnamate dioxygenase ferredoxin reductase subunit
MNDEIVIIGGGHSGAQLCAGLAEAGMGNRVTLVCGEDLLPYHRPPLSKAFHKSADETAQLHRAEAWYAEAGVTVLRGDPATAIDRDRQIVTLRSGSLLPYGRLVLATGSRARLLADIPEDLANVATLRTVADAHALRDKLSVIQALTVVGGGFIGLEFAATARSLGKAVTVVEYAPRLLGRAVSPEISSYVLALHRNAGIDVHLDARIAHFELQDTGRARLLASIELDGRRHPVDFLLLGIGALPETSLAESAGLACDNGIVVDEYMVTSDPAILAVGDCTSFPDHASGKRLRLESVQNANDQARTAVATLTGSPRPHHAVAWFWSEQGTMRLQMAGLLPADPQSHRRPGAKPDSFSIFHYVNGALHCVESVNAPMDHMMARKLLEAGVSPDAAKVSDPKVALKSLLP